MNNPLHHPRNHYLHIRITMDIQAALKDGYTQEEVMAELGKRTGMNYQQALKDGHDPNDVLMELNKRDSGKVNPQPQPLPKEESTGFISDVGSSIAKRSKNIARELTTVAPAASASSTFARSPGTALRSAGQLAGMGGDIIGAGVKSLYKSLMPEEAQKAISSGVNTVLNYQPVASGISALQSAYEGVKKNYPEEVGNVEAIANIAGLVPLGKGGAMAFGAAKPYAKEGANIASDVYKIATKTPPGLVAQRVDKAIEDGVNRAIRPSVVGKSTAPQNALYMDKAKNAVKAIVENKDNLALTNASGETVKSTLPKSLSQFSEAIDQTKKKIFTDYDAMAREAGEQGAKVDLNPLVSELRSIGNQTIINDFSPQISKYAADLADTLEKRGFYTASEAQDAITHLNKQLEAFYKNPSYENARQAGIDAIVANNIRKSLDTAIEGTIGEAYQPLKNAWGSLRTTEKDVVHRQIVDARKNLKGLADFTDIMTAGELAAGIASMNLGMMVKGAIGKGVKEYIKAVNNPNRIVRNMFGDVENIINKNSVGYKSELFSKPERLRAMDAESMANMEKNAQFAKQAPLVPEDIQVPAYLRSKQQIPPTMPTMTKNQIPWQDFSLKGEPFQGGTTVGQPYGPEILRPVKSARPESAIDAEHYLIKLLENKGGRKEFLRIPWQDFQTGLSREVIEDATRKLTADELKDFVTSLRNIKKEELISPGIRELIGIARENIKKRGIESKYPLRGNK